MIFQETYEVEDCYLNSSQEYTRTHNSSTAVSNTIIDGFEWDNTEDWEFSCEIKVSGYSQRIDIVPPSENLNHHLGFGKSGDNNYMRFYVGKASSGENAYTTSQVITNNTYYPITIKKVGTTVTFTFNGVTWVNTFDVAWLDNYPTETIKFTQWRANTIWVKNIKIKAL